MVFTVGLSSLQENETLVKIGSIRVGIAASEMDLSFAPMNKCLEVKIGYGLVTVEFLPMIIRRSGVSISDGFIKRWFCK